MKQLFPAIAALLLITACKKETDIQIKEVEKTYSWTEVKQLYGTKRIILGMSQNGSTLFLQEPGFQGLLTPQPTDPLYRQYGYYRSAATYFPTNIRVRLPMSATFIAQPDRDTLVELLPPTEPVTQGYRTYIHLRKLDAQATGVTTEFSGSSRPFGAINRNNYLLFSYRTATASADPTLRFILANVQAQPAGNLKQQARVVTVPVGAGTNGVYVRWITAIDDYFLVNCGDAGLYKIREDGTFRRVYGYSVTDACYEWQGTVYLVEEYNSILKSEDDGETWQRFTGTPDVFDFTTYYVVGDSLIGVTPSPGQLFTLRWNGNRYSTRILKNDGLGQGDVRGLEQLGDTVYVGTTSGLFKRPLKAFFETKTE